VASAGSNARTRGKVWERQVAKDMGTKRSGPTGMNDADVIHDTLGIECKAYKRIAWRDADWAQTLRNAKGRVPILAMKELNTGRRIVFMEYEYFLSLHKEHNNGQH
jgi:hypothetical protein